MTFPISSFSQGIQSPQQAQFRERVLQRVREKEAISQGEKVGIKIPTVSIEPFDDIRIFNNAAKAISQPELSQVQPPQTKPFVQEKPTSLPPEFAAHLNAPDTQAWLNDVQKVAEKTGIIDCRAEDILRAKAYGSSLLADYTV